MQIAIIGTGFIATTLGRPLARAGHQVVYGSRRPGDDAAAASDTGGRVSSVGDALSGAEVVILALPGAAVADLTSAHGEALVDALVIDATNQMGAEVANARASLPTSVRYARAFNTLGGENMADPVIDGQQLDMFFSAPAADHDTVATVIDAVGLRPVYLGEDKEALTDALFRVWIALAMEQGRGRRLALQLLQG